MAKKFRKMSVSDETKEYIHEAVMNTFLKHNPKMKGLKITEDYIIKHIAEFYVEA